MHFSKRPPLSGRIIFLKYLSFLESDIDEFSSVFDSSLTFLIRANSESPRRLGRANKMLPRVIELRGYGRSFITNEPFNDILSLVVCYLRSKAGNVSSGSMDADFRSVEDMDDDPHTFAMQIYHDFQIYK